MKTTFCLALLSTALLAACQSGPLAPTKDNQQTLWIAKDLGLKQCEQTSARDALAQSRHTLKQNQVQVLDARCVDDGMMRIQMCGASQGKLGLYKIAASQLDSAQAMGFTPANGDQYPLLDCS